MRDFLKDFDNDKTGSINHKRSQERMGYDEINTHLASYQLESQDAYTLSNLIVGDCKGIIDLEPFVQCCLQPKGEARTIDIAQGLRRGSRESLLTE